MKAKILIVDDELVICKSCEKIFRRAGHAVAYATSGRQAISMLESDSFDVIFTDLKMIDIGGMEVLHTVKQKYPDTVVVVITGYATIASAVETMRGGAFDFLPKPFTPNELMAVLERALEKRKINRIASGQDHGFNNASFEGLVGNSRRMQEVYSLIEKVAPTDSTVLIIGESGTGKDLTAKAIHCRSKRKGGKFFAIDISTFSSGLLESELFGHVKGAFTGAVSDKQGVFEVADGGTIFLDEIGNLSLEAQSRLLRVLQEKEVLPVGSTSIKKVDVRLILATNQNLKQLAMAGKFREDLFYRLNVFPLRLPSLRERPEDIPDLTIHFLKKYCAQMGRSVPKVRPEAIDALVEYHWPGNVRELEHAMERLSILVEGSEIEPSHVSAVLFRTETNTTAAIPRSAGELKSFKKQIREAAVQEVERQFVLESLIRNDWNVTKAARDADMQRSNFQTLMRKYGIKRPDAPA